MPAMRIVAIPLLTALIARVTFLRFRACFGFCSASLGYYSVRARLSEGSAVQEPRAALSRPKGSMPVVTAQNLPSPNPNPSTPHFPSSPRQKSAMTLPITLQNL